MPSESARRIKRAPWITNGRQLVTARQSERWSQPQLAGYLGVIYETVSNWERGVAPISPLVQRVLRYVFTYGPLGDEAAENLK